MYKIRLKLVKMFFVSAIGLGLLNFASINDWSVSYLGVEEAVAGVDCSVGIENSPCGWMFGCIKGSGFWSCGPPCLSCE